jgi:hypothetical protein
MPAIEPLRGKREIAVTKQDLESQDDAAIQRQKAEAPSDSHRAAGSRNLRVRILTAESIQRHNDC